MINAVHVVNAVITDLTTLVLLESSDHCWVVASGLHNPVFMACFNAVLRPLQELRPLVYPLTQVLLGAVRLVPTPRYFPLRLRCIRALLGLGRAVGQFIPLSPLLLEMLQVRHAATVYNLTASLLLCSLALSPLHAITHCS